MSSWIRTKLRDVIEIKHGYAFDGVHFRDEPPGDILLTPGNFEIGGGFKADKFKYYDGPVPDEFVLSEGDLLVTMTDLSKAGDTLGYPAIVPKLKGRRYLHNQRLGKVLVLPNAPIYRKFLYFLLRTRGYRDEVLASATGTTVKHTSPRRIKEFSFLRPPIEQQMAIAQVLAALDDKIELNRRVNETMEAMARAIFKSWFVDFDPVRAKAEGRQPFGMDAATAALFPDSFQDSPVGKIPRGWRATPLPEAVDVNPPRSLPKGQEAAYLDMQNVPTRGHRPMGWIRRVFVSGSRFTNGDTLLARITPCLENGKTAFVDFLKEGEVGWGSTEFIVLRPKDQLPPEYGYCLARDEGFRNHAIQNMTGSSGRQRVPTESLSQFFVVIPTEAVARRFGRILGPLFRKAKACSEESAALAAIRDALLPKLISGELRTKDATRLAGVT